MVAAARSSSSADTRARLAELIPRLGAAAPAAERTMPVHPALDGLFPQGVVRGSTVACVGAAAASTALLLLAGPVQAGSWGCVVGLPTFGPGAAAEAGVALERVVVVREPAAAAFDESTWAQALAAGVDGFDIVVLGAGRHLRAATARRVQARLQARGAVLVLVGAAGAFTPDLQVTGRADWHGLGAGHGYLRTRRVTLGLGGRRLPRDRHDTLWFPGPSGVVERAGAHPSPLHRQAG
jgi:hypothetical protein